MQVTNTWQHTDAIQLRAALAELSNDQFLTGFLNLIWTTSKQEISKFSEIIQMRKREFRRRLSNGIQRGWKWRPLNRTAHFLVWNIAETAGSAESVLCSDYLIDQANSESWWVHESTNCHQGIWLIRYRDSFAFVWARLSCYYSEVNIHDIRHEDGRMVDSPAIDQSNTSVDITGAQPISCHLIASFFFVDISRPHRSVPGAKKYVIMPINGQIIQLALRIPVFLVLLFLKTLHGVVLSAALLVASNLQKATCFSSLWAIHRWLKK